MGKRPHRYRRRQAKLAQIQKTLPRGIEIVAGYDRSGLIQESINTLNVICSRGYHCKSRHHHFSLSLALGLYTDSRAADSSHRGPSSDVLFADQLQHHVTRRPGAGDRCGWSTLRS